VKRSNTDRVVRLFVGFVVGFTTGETRLWIALLCAGAWSFDERLEVVGFVVLVLVDQRRLPRRGDLVQPGPLRGADLADETVVF